MKNLENVQGDERDIIVISTVYGPSSDGGSVFQRFGPINSRMGHRRLNVLFTRAKERVIVVTSLRPEDVKLQAGSNPGVMALKRYLEFARSGRLEVGTAGEGVTRVHSRLRLRRCSSRSDITLLRRSASLDSSLIWGCVIRLIPIILFSASNVMAPVITPRRARETEIDSDKRYLRGLAGPCIEFGQRTGFVREARRSSASHSTLRNYRHERTDASHQAVSTSAKTPRWLRHPLNGDKRWEIGPEPGFRIGVIYIISL